MDELQTEDKISKRVMQVVANTSAVDTDTLNHASKLEDIYTDSLELFALVSAFEKEFSLTASYTDLMNIETIGDIVYYLKNKTA
jgi:acyl carrier protein